MNRFVIADSTLCIGCHTCEAACSETHRQHGLQSMPRLKVMLNEKESAPQLCHHCEDAPCATVCPVNAINRVDGAVQLNESLCVSCKLCGIACPFGAIEFSGSRPLHIPANANTPKAPPAESFLALPTCRNLRESTENFQREMIRQALAQNNHNWAASARALETDVANLHRLAKRLGLKD
ncbi:anaerobic nitric oxide reductase transcription regulator NorR [Salmonella enterica]